MSNEEPISWATSKCRDLGADDFSVLLYHSDEGQARFGNNSLTITNRLLNKELVVYMTKGKKRIFGELSTIDRGSVERFVERLFKSMQAAGGESEFPHLPSGPFKYSFNGDFDPRVSEFDVAGNASKTIEAALAAGARRVAGSLSTERYTITISTSSGVSATEERSRFLLNVRSFTDREASGQGVTVSTNMDDFDVEAAGRTSGENAKLSQNPKQVEVGDYAVILGPTVAAELIQHVGSSTSAFNVEAGLSFLAGSLGKEVAAEAFTLVDHGQIRNGLRSRSFDDEGVPTRSNSLIEKGVLKTYIHNSTTAAKHKAALTGNAGLLEPHLWNIEVKGGSHTLEEMIRDTNRGIYVTNNWYTRFQSYTKGEYSTLPRDAAWLIENGELKTPVAGIRLSGEIPRQIKEIDAIGKERRWVQWWEVDVPTLIPALRIPNVRVTKASG
jgi:PmbA protein